MFIDAYLGLCGAVATGSCTEFAMPGYSRQPISFVKPTFGLSRNSTPWTFGAGFGAGTMAGRAIFDAPVGGNLLFVLPHATARPAPIAGPSDNGNPGDIALLFSAVPYLPALSNGDAFTGILPAGAAVGITWDIREVISVVNAISLANAQAGAPAGATVVALDYPQFQIVSASPLSVGGQLSINRGVLQLEARAEGAVS